MDTDERDAQLTPLDVIRVETALSRFPMHRLAKTGAVEIVIREQNTTGDLLRWEVSYNSKFGQPGPLAYKLDTLVINREIEAAGRPIPKVVKLGSLREIADTTGTGAGNTTTIKRALYQNSSAYITAKVCYRATDGTERSIEIGDTRYAVVFTGENLPDGRTADAVYIVLHDFYREILDHALTRPLDYDYLRELPPAAQRLYELASYPIFGAIKHGRPKAKLAYSEFCLHAPQTRYEDFDRVKRQMYKVHAPHLKTGYVSRIEFEAKTAPDGRPDWTMHYTPGPKAKAEYRAFTKKEGGPAVLEAEPAAPKPEPEPEPAGLRSLVDHGVTPSTACELVATYPADRIRAKIEHVDRIRKTSPKKLKDAAAYLVGAIRADYVVTPEPVVPVEEADRDHERALQAQAQDRAERLRMRRFWEGLSPAEREAFDREALAHADPEQRAEYDRQDDPRLRRLHLTPIRDAHIRARLAAG